MYGIYLIDAFETQGYKGKVESCRLANNGEDRKLETDASRKTAGPHLAARHRITSFSNPLNGIVPVIMIVAVMALESSHNMTR